jgi:hypothetical protein
MGHREPIDLSAIKIMCNTQYSGIPRYSGKRETVIMLTEKEHGLPDRTHPADFILYCKPPRPSLGYRSGREKTGRQIIEVLKL